MAQPLPSVTITSSHTYAVNDPNLLILQGWRLAREDPDQADHYGLRHGTPMSPKTALCLVIAAIQTDELTETAGQYGLTHQGTRIRAAAELAGGIFCEIHEAADDDAA